MENRHAATSGEQSPEKFQNQTARLYAKFESGQTTTTLEGFQEGTLRTASRVFDLKKMGVPIFKRWIWVDGHRIREYATRPFDDDGQQSLFGGPGNAA